MEGYIDFIRSTLLSETKLTEAFVDNLLSRETNQTEFKIALTDYSAGKEYNYQVHEFIGDGILKGCTTIYIAKRLPEIKKEGILTTINHNLVSNKFYAALAREMGIDRFSVVSDSFRENFKDRNLENETYKDFMGDLFEAFFGAIIKSMRNDGYQEGEIFQVCYDLIASFLDRKGIPLTLVDLKDSTSKLNEIYPTLGWPNINKMEKSDALPDGGYKHIIYGYALNDTEKKNRIILGEGTAPGAKAAKRIAYDAAFAKLTSYYGIQDKVVNPYVYSKTKSK
jgi:dsRNA-specific ribonuclease